MEIFMKNTYIFKNEADVIFAGVWTKQTCSLTSAEYDFKAGAPL